SWCGDRLWNLQTCADSRPRRRNGRGHAMLGATRRLHTGVCPRGLRRGTTWPTSRVRSCMRMARAERVVVLDCVRCRKGVMVAQAASGAGADQIREELDHATRIRSATSNATSAGCAASYDRPCALGSRTGVGADVVDRVAAIPARVPERDLV